MVPRVLLTSFSSLAPVLNLTLSPATPCLHSSTPVLLSAPSSITLHNSAPFSHPLPCFYPQITPILSPSLPYLLSLLYCNIKSFLRFEIICLFFSFPSFILFTFLNFFFVSLFVVPENHTVSFAFLFLLSLFFIFFTTRVSFSPATCYQPCLYLLSLFQIMYLFLPFPSVFLPFLSFPVLTIPVYASFLL